MGTLVIEVGVPVLGGRCRRAVNYNVCDVDWLFVQKRVYSWIYREVEFWFEAGAVVEVDYDGYVAVVRLVNEEDVDAFEPIRKFVEEIGRNVLLIRIEDISVYDILFSIIPDLDIDVFAIGVGKVSRAVSR